MRLRLERARECLDSALREIDAGAYKEAASRSYYCQFHTMRAVLALDGFDSKKHSGIMSEFGRKYIKTGVFPKEFSKTIRSSFKVRNDSDYDDYYVISKEEVTQQVENSRAFLTAVGNYIETLT